MMKIKQLLIGLSMLPTIVCAKDGCIHDYGSTFCGNVEIEHVATNGITTMHGTTVTKHAEINGTLLANDVTLNTLAVNGTASLSSADISARAEFNGTLKAKRSRFLGSLYLGSNSSQFDNCATKDIFVGNSSAPQPKVVLVGTTVSGNVVFSDQKGTVYVCSGSKISGQVLGGEIIEGC